MVSKSFVPDLSPVLGLTPTQVLQLNSLRPTNDAFCAVLRTRLKASLPLMKSLKPFAKTFFSEHFLTPEQDEAAITAKEAVEIKNVGTLVDLGVEQEKLGEDVLEWTTESGTGRGFHGGLCGFACSSARR